MLFYLPRVLDILPLGRSPPLTLGALRGLPATAPKRVCVHRIQFEIHTKGFDVGSGGARESHSSGPKSRASTLSSAQMKDVTPGVEGPGRMSQRSSRSRALQVTGEGSKLAPPRVPGPRNPPASCTWILHGLVIKLMKCSFWGFYDLNQSPNSHW